MNVSIEIIEKPKREQVVIQCYDINAEINAILRYIKEMDGSLSGYIDERIHRISLQDIYYVETVDNTLFAYTEHQIYELKMKLYEFEALYQKNSFFRCSKAAAVNLMKIESVYSILNGRLSARLYNGEEIIISRQYTRELKKWLLGGSI